MENSLLTLTNLRELFWGEKTNSEHLLLNRLDTPNIHIPSSHYNTSEHIPFPVITPRTKQSVFFVCIFGDYFQEFLPDQYSTQEAAIWSNLFNGKRALTLSRRKGMLQTILASNLSDNRNIIIDDIQTAILSSLECWRLNDSSVEILNTYISKIPEAEMRENSSLATFDNTTLADLLTFVHAHLDICSNAVNPQDRFYHMATALTYLALGALLRDNIEYLRIYYTESKEQYDADTISGSTVTLYAALLSHLQDTQNSFYASNLVDTFEASLCPTGHIANSAKSPTNISLKNFLRQYWQAEHRCHLYIQGIGGIGKTTSLLHLSLDKNVNIDNIPVVFIPLKTLDGYISSTQVHRDINWFLFTYFPDEAPSIIKLAGSRWIHRPNIIFILDGLNELSAESFTAITKDIKDWSEKRGIQLIISSRSPHYFNNSFIVFETHLLSDKMITDFLSQKNCPISALNFSLLNTPFLIQLYLFTENIKKKWQIPGITSAYWKNQITHETDLILNYLQAELTHCWNTDTEDINKTEFAYAILITAPYLFWNMVQQNKFELTDNELWDLISNANKQIPHNLHNTVEEFKKIERKVGKFISFDDNHIMMQYNIFSKQDILFRMHIDTADNRHEIYYAPIHQNFRDALAGLHIFNLITYFLFTEECTHAPLSSDIISTNNYDVLRYLSEYLSPVQLANLWELNRNSIPTMVHQSKWLLNLIGIQSKNDFSNISFSEMDLTNINLANCCKNDSIHLTLPQKQADFFKHTYVSASTFSPEGHSAMVNNAAVYNNGHRCISASSDHTLKVWDLDSYECLGILTGHGCALRALSVYPYGTGFRCISGSYDGLICIWDLTELSIGGLLTTRPLFTMQSHTSDINDLAVYDNGHRCISASSDSTLIIWNLDTGNPMFPPLIGHTGTVNVVKVFAHETKCISGDSNDSLYIWDLNSGCPLYGPLHIRKNISNNISDESHSFIASSTDNALSIWKVHTIGINAIDICENSSQTTCVAASSNSRLSVWNLTGEKPIGFELSKHTKGINTVKIFDNGKKCVSGSDDNTLIVWDLMQKKVLGTPLQEHNDWIIRLDVYKFNNVYYCVSASFDNTIKLWNLDSLSLVDTLTGHSDWVQAISVYPFNTSFRCVSVSADCSIRLWDLISGDLLHTITGYSKMIRAIDSFEKNNKFYCVIASSDGILRLWDLESYRCIGILEGHTAWVNAVKVYANGTRCISAASDHTLRVWDLENHECVYVLKGHTDWVIDIDVFKKGEDFFAISASYDRTLKIWNLSHGSCVGSSLVGHNAGVKTVMVYDHGSKAISGSYDHTLQIWDLNSRKAIGSPLIGHTEWVRDLDVYFSDKKALCLSAASDGTFILWDLSTGSLIHSSSRDYHSTITAIHFLDGNKRCVTASSDGMIEIWDLNSFKLSAPPIFIEPRSRINALCIYGSNRCISVSDDGMMHIFDLNTCSLIRSIDVMHGISIVGIDLSKATFEDDLTKKYLDENGGII